MTCNPCPQVCGGVWMHFRGFSGRTILEGFCVCTVLSWHMPTAKAKDMLPCPLRVLR